MDVFSRRATAIFAIFAAFLLTVSVTVANAGPARADAATRSISGTVTLPAGQASTNFAGVQVYVWQIGGANNRTATPASNGTFTVNDLPPGTYKVQFTAVPIPGTEPSVTPAYATEYYPSVFGSEAASLVDLSTNDATGINATMDWAGFIAGKVTVASGLPGDWIKGVKVNVWSANGASAQTRPDPVTGDYAIDDLPAGGYTVQFEVGSYDDGGTLTWPDLMTEYYNNVYGPSAATLVNVAAPAGAGNINAELSDVGHFTSSPLPTITVLKLNAGSTLGSKTGIWMPSAAFAYQWKRNGVAIPGATKSTYVIKTGDVGKKITLTVTGTRVGFAATSRTSAALLIPKTFTKVFVPKISGTARAGYTLTAVRGTWSPTPKYTYQWYRSGVKIAGATSKTYKVKSADKGKKITVKVTGKQTGYTTVTKTSPSRTVAR